MTDEELESIVAGIVDAEDAEGRKLTESELDALLEQFSSLDADTRKDIKDTILQLRDADALADLDAKSNPLSLDKVDAQADAAARQAKKMANEDNTDVTVTEEDKDSDGDIDKVTIKKESPETDSEFDEDELEVLKQLNGDSDKPHDVTNVGHLAEAVNRKY